MSPGSWVASSGANTAISAIATSSTAPMTSVGCLRSQRPRRFGSVAGSAAAPSSRAGTALTASRVADARIEQRVAEIDQQVDEDVDARREQQHALDHRIVVALHRIDDEAADAGNREHRLGDDDAADQEGDADAHRR